MELTAQQIQKYKSKSLPALKKTAKKYFHTFVRKRDTKDESWFTCCSCGQNFIIRGTKMHAGHYYSAGNHPGTEFDLNNTFAQCDRCNTHLSGNLIEYTKFMQNKFSKEELQLLEIRAKSNFIPDRLFYISIIETYK